MSVVRALGAWLRRINPLRSPVSQFMAAALVAVLLVGLAAAALLRSAAIEEATRDARQLSSLVGIGIVEPHLVQGVIEGRQGAERSLDRVVDERVLEDESIVRVKIWDESGRIVYSDEPRLTGERFELDDEELEILGTNEVKAEPTDLDEPENRFDRGEGELVEVYRSISAPDGSPLLFETYFTSDEISESGNRIWLNLAPLLIGGLLLLAALQVPLAFSLARRLRRGRDEREALLARALDASNTERRRIAQDLHDGVVQDLAGVSYGLSAAADRARNGGDPECSAMDRAARQTRQSLRELRTLLVDIYPPDLHRAGLEAAMADLAATLRTRSVETELVVDPDLELPAEIETLFYRSAQEAARNIVKHSDAAHATIRVIGHDGEAQLEVTDDGDGFDSATPANGHFGLRMLSDLARDAGGELRVDSVPGRGTQLSMRVPVR
ncbi:sensor histidine kinase [Thermoleophilia bacterium SCSIO 60948]|nr:sensor histidine kinase [Thermoleophilia bacterium SCSIO 60948]